MSLLMRLVPTTRTTDDILAALHNTCAELLARQDDLKERNNARARRISELQDTIDHIEAECESANDEIVYNFGVHNNIKALLTVTEAAVAE